MAMRHPQRQRTTKARRKHTMHKAAETVPQPQRAVRDSSGTGLSYMVSSQDLRAGLEVRLLAVAQLPADLLRELQRLRGCWQDEAGSAGRQLASYAPA